jgi:myo-inositol-1(or 4)-monophosphatase
MQTPGEGSGSGLESELAFVKYLAREVAEIALARCKRVQPLEKANLTFVTDLDHDLEQMIRERLAGQFPDDALTGEEYAAAGGAGPRRWSIDPIDGTGNLVHGLPLWAVSIGLIDAGEPVLGVIVIPPLYEMFWAVKGCGAWRDGHRIECRDADGFHNQDNVCVGTNALRAVDTRTLPGRLRDLGTACCEIAFTACNRLQACTFLGEATHDIAAGTVIAAEAGCAFGTIDGRVLSPREMVASAPISTPTFVAPPRRLKALMTAARRLPPLSVTISDRSRM